MRTAKKNQKRVTARARHQKPTERAVRLLPLAAALTAAMAAGQAQATVRFSPYIGVSLTYVDNIDLAVASANKNSDLVAQLTPGFSFEQSNEKLKTNVDYGARGLFSSEDSGRNETFHQLSANSTATVIDRYFFFDANARYAQIGR